MSLRTGRPPCTSDEECDLTLPPQYSDQILPPWLSESLPDERSGVPIFPSDLRLSLIKSRIHRSLRSAPALQKSDAELLQSIRELDHELEVWKMSLPPQSRPTLGLPSDSPTADACGMRSVMLQLDCFQCFSAIHQASGRCKLWTDDQIGAMDGVYLSLELCVEASRLSLLFLHKTSRHLGSEIFR
jgi:hypothetical protein